MSSRINSSREARTQRADGEQTRNRILDAAEELFADEGYSAASLRAIAQRAGVNLAAAHYHFGSKTGLFAAAIHRHAEPLNEQRRILLEQVHEDDGKTRVEAIMRAFFAPLAQGALADGRLPRLIARIYGEPGGVGRKLLTQEFSETLQRFIGALDGAIVELDREELTWRFHFVVGAMVHLLNFDTPPGMSEGSGDVEGRVERLLAFSVAGIVHGTAVGREDHEHT
ncbi:MAG: TetR/AcrR family transcriptional regulator [Pseudomonadales bacterium]|jgi:AcrR family transcriptional regulator|nr:TetR/AcrR family transcriptional regulator [Pseudomonadales bacterium]MDP6470554.1 TetR/AcrR family transcriptional regulator [Pseudomonadales bacterium]MDP6827856.1 TetR/AcrR family transcriptional regulator [Pseudomonadales bacterium]MDP6970555.1 TetR/AcrR family transcriptional regulator [Pseudomonadales bacterium]|tara:strand:- start:3787 stop:4464 length:678 start_codon:yes stop_codon:yes gene_type:complete